MEGQSSFLQDCKALTDHNKTIIEVPVDTTKQEMPEQVSGRVPKAPIGKKKGRGKKRDAGQFRKAPQAPKRFKSSYIFFFTENQAKVKEQLGPQATVADVSRRSAEIWRNLSEYERTHWEEAASLDKERYMAEKTAYTGPWQVPHKRVKKDPSAPKRPMSAFLYFSQDRRGAIKKKNPTLLNTEVSSILGDIWRNASDEEKKKYRDHEEKQRAKYKNDIKRWRDEEAARNDLAKKAQDKQTELLIKQRREQQEAQHNAAIVAGYAQSAATAKDPLYYPNLSYAYETVSTPYYGQDISVHTQAPQPQPPTRFGSYHRPSPPTYHDVVHRPYVANHYELSRTTAPQYAGNHTIGQSAHVPFEDDRALVGEHRYYLAEPHHTDCSGALKSDSNYTIEDEMISHPPHPQDSTNHMDAAHAYPHHNWHDQQISSHSYQMYGMQSHTSHGGPSQPHNSYHGPYYYNDGDPSANAGPYQGKYTNQDERQANDHDKRYG